MLQRFNYHSDELADNSEANLPPIDAFDDDIQAVLVVACEDSRFLHHGCRQMID